MYSNQVTHVNHVINSLRTNCAFCTNAGKSYH